MDHFWQAPPISRTLTAGTLTLSVLCYTGFLPFQYFGWYLGSLLKLPPQIWRLATCFMISRPQLGIVFDPYFMYMYGSKLETASPRFSQPGDFFTYILFVCFTIVGINTWLFGGGFLTVALLLALAYTSTQDERGQKARFIVVDIPAQWVPYAMIVLTCVIDGPHAAQVQATGLVAAHLYDFLARIWPTFGGGRNLLPTPSFIRRLFQTTEVHVGHRGYGTAITPAQRTAGTASGSSTGTVLPESWKSRGSGHRLGGD